MLSYLFKIGMSCLEREINSNIDEELSKKKRIRKER